MTEHKSLVFRFDDVEVGEREFLLIKAGGALPCEEREEPTASSGADMPVVAAENLLFRQAQM
jgi:hypothetical protein